MAFAGGWYLSSEYDLHLEATDTSNETILANLEDIFDQGDASYIFLAVAQNVRILLLSILLGVFSFGVMGIFFAILPFGIIGFVMGNLVNAEINPVPFIFAVIPHGIFEIPAIVLSAAAALQVGAVITRIPEKMTVGEAWLRQLADTLKVFFALALPMLIIAAVLEVQLTPRVVEWIFSR
jgi:stage II sporulation protein M